MLITWDDVGTALLIAATFAMTIAIGKILSYFVILSKGYAKRQGNSDKELKAAREAMAPSLIEALLESLVGYVILGGFVFVGVIFPGSMTGDSSSVVIGLLLIFWLLMGFALLVARIAVGKEFLKDMKKRK